MFLFTCIQADDLRSHSSWLTFMTAFSTPCHPIDRDRRPPVRPLLVSPVLAMRHGPGGDAVGEDDFAFERRIATAVEHLAGVDGVDFEFAGQSSCMEWVEPRFRGMISAVSGSDEHARGDPGGGQSLTTRLMFCSIEEVWCGRRRVDARLRWWSQQRMSQRNRLGVVDIEVAPEVGVDRERPAKRSCRRRNHEPCSPAT